MRWQQSARPAGGPSSLPCVAAPCRTAGSICSPSGWIASSPHSTRSWAAAVRRRRLQGGPRGLRLWQDVLLALARRPGPEDGLRHLRSADLGDGNPAPSPGDGLPQAERATRHGGHARGRSGTSSMAGFSRSRRTCWPRGRSMPMTRSGSAEEQRTARDTALGRGTDHADSQRALRGYRQAQVQGSRPSPTASWPGSGQPNVAAEAKRFAGVKGDIDHFGHSTSCRACSRSSETPGTWGCCSCWTRWRPSNASGATSGTRLERPPAADRRGRLLGDSPDSTCSSPARPRSSRGPRAFAPGTSRPETPRRFQDRGPLRQPPGGPDPAPRLHPGEAPLVGGKSATSTSSTPGNPSESGVCATTATSPIWPTPSRASSAARSA